MINVYSHSRLFLFKHDAKAASSKDQQIERGHMMRLQTRDNHVEELFCNLKKRQEKCVKCLKNIQFVNRSHMFGFVNEN